MQLGTEGGVDGGGEGDADGGDGGGGGEIADGSHSVALGAGSHAIDTASPCSSRLEWQRLSNGGLSFGLYCSGSSGEYSHGE